MNLETILLFFPSLGWPEMMVILGVVLLIFGPQKLPEIADAMGKSIQKFKQAARETREEIEPPKTGRTDDP